MLNPNLRTEGCFVDHSSRMVSLESTRRLCSTCPETSLSSPSGPLSFFSFFSFFSFNVCWLSYNSSSFLMQYQSFLTCHIFFFIYSFCISTFNPHHFPLFLLFFAFQKCQASLTSSAKGHTTRYTRNFFNKMTYTSWYTWLIIHQVPVDDYSGWLVPYPFAK